MADAIQHLYARLAVPSATLDAYCQRLEASSYPISISQLSRYRTGKAVPSEEFLLALHRAATKDNGDTGISLDRLLQLRAAARNETGRAATVGKRAKTAAGPMQIGDRQQRTEEAVLSRRTTGSDDVQSAVTTVAGLHHRGRREDALTAIQALPDLLGPPGSAACVVEFRQRDEHTLAEALIRSFSQMRAHGEVLHLALALNRCGLIPEANLAMSTALKGRRPPVSVA